MKSKIQCQAIVSDGGILQLPRSFVGDVAVFRGRNVFITVEDATAKRSENANAYYWAAIVDAITDRFNELGERFDTATVHEILKYKFLLVTIPDLNTGEILVQYVRSTADLKIHEFSFYLEDCIRYAAEDLELTIQPPKARRADYIFPIFSKTNEVREKYISRISKYVQDVFQLEHLVRFFNQNDEWENDDDIKKVFRERAEQIKALVKG